jgi:STAS-like domain of unknown function (DUF4325)
MVIRIVDIVGAADTADQGSVVFARLRAALASSNRRQVIVSFEGVKTATSSFVNTAFVQLLELMPLAEIKRRIRVVASSRQINDMIRSRLEREALVAAS